MIYLEIIELNCYNLNYNLKKNIIKRSSGDLNEMENRENSISSLFSEESEENKSLNDI